MPALEGYVGAWGHESFENDSVLDWVWEAEKAEDFSVIEAALDQITSDSDNYRENRECTEALGAAEIVAALLGRPCAHFPDELAAWARGRPKPYPYLVAKAKLAVAAIQASSELREVWGETEYFAAWQQSVSDLAQRLQA